MGAVRVGCEPHALQYLWQSSGKAIRSATYDYLLIFKVQLHNGSLWAHTYIALPSFVVRMPNACVH